MFEDAAEFAKASQEKVGAGYVYSRWANPTVDAFAAAVADLEGAEDAEGFSSGMAAIATTLLTLCESGDRVVAARQLYGGTHSLTQALLPRFGIQTDLVDIDDHEGIRAAVRGAKALYCETIGNPTMRVANLPVLGEIADEAGVPMIVDNTFASPVLCRPLELGARITIHSATKFLGGHHDITGGVVCGDPASLARIRELVRELGPTMSPFNAWLALRGISTIHLRVERSCRTASKNARALEQDADVERVFFPALETSPDKALADELLGGNGGANLAFDLAGGRDRAARFQNALKVIKAAASLGGSHSLLVHAASVTHTQLSPEELQAAGISEGFCRLSVGIEDEDDLLGDLDQALRASA